MDHETFIGSLSNSEAPNEASPLQRALWHAKQGAWAKAHTIAQDIEGSEGSAVHAYLHRVEGDDGNAGYWYSRAGRKRFAGSLDEEWNSLVAEFSE